MAFNYRKSRTLTLSFLYQAEFQEIPSTDLTAPALEFFGESDISKKEIDYALLLIKGIQKHQEDLDSRISLYSQNWAIHRINLVDLNILRVGIFEILFCLEIPNKVALDEALEIAKIFGDNKSKNFINGILDKVLNNDLSCKTS